MTRYHICYYDPKGNFFRHTVASEDRIRILRQVKRIKRIEKGLYPDSIGQVIYVFEEEE